MTIPAPYVIEKNGGIERSYDIYSRLLRDRVIIVNGQVDEHMVTSIIAQLLFLAQDDPDKDISMYINSPGGSVYDGLAIIDTMLFIKPDVRTYAIGKTMSMGSLFLTMGAKGKRFIAPHATVMIHQPSGGTEGQASDIEITANEILRLRAMLNNMFVKTSKITAKNVKAYMDRDTYLSAEDTVALGIADHVLKAD